MGNHKFALLIIVLLNLGTLLVSLACDCPPTHPPKVKPPVHPKPPPTVPKPPPKPHVKPPFHPKPPVVKPPPTVPKPKPPPKPHVKPPVHPKPPPTVPKPPPKPPVVEPPPPTVPKPPPKPPVVEPPPPTVPEPPVTNPPPPPETPCPPPPPAPSPPSPSPPPPETCPIDALKLSGCVDVLGGLVHVGIGQSAKDTCCPVLEGLLGLDAAVCLCTTIKVKLLNINIILPIALQLLVDCGKSPPSGFQCPS